MNGKIAPEIGFTEAIKREADRQSRREWKARQAAEKETYRARMAR
jgi:hypothetical protein